MSKRFMLFLFCKIFASKKPPSVREVRRRGGFHTRPRRGVSPHRFHPNGNSAFCLSMANILSRVMTRTAVMLDFSTLLPCPASSL